MSKFNFDKQKELEFGNFLLTLPTENMTQKQIEEAFDDNFPKSRTLTIDEWEAEMDIYFAELATQNNK
jgi:hypothetical protein